MKHAGRSGLIGLVVVIGFVVLALGFVFALQVMLFEAKQAKKQTQHRAAQQESVRNPQGLP